MATVELKGLYTVRAKGKVYVYAWRNGPRVHSDALPGTPEFMIAYNEAIAEHRAPDASRFASIIRDYKKSDAYKALAASTRRNWSPWLDRIEEHFGPLSIAQFNRAEKIRLRIRQWRAGFAATPRKADYGMQVLSRVCSHGVDPMGKLASNPCEGVAHLYKGDRSEIIWTDSDLARFKAKASPEVARVVELASLTGLRLSDLLRLSWSHVGEDAIEMRTGKSRGRRTAIVPLFDELRDLLAEIPRRSTAVLTNTRKRPWTPNGYQSSHHDTLVLAGMANDNLHFHDLRGTAATKLYLGGIEMRVIAEIMGWEEEQVERIIRRYVGRKAATLDTIRRMREAKERTQDAKPAAKPSRK